MAELKVHPPGARPPHRTAASYAVLVVSLLLLCWVLSPLWQALLFAAIFAAALASAQSRLTTWLRGWRYLAATVMTVLVVVLILTPLALIGMLAIRQAAEVMGSIRGALDRGGLIALIRPLPDEIERWLRPVILRLPKSLTTLPGTDAPGTAGWAAAAAEHVQTIFATVSTFAFDLLMMLIALFFLLADGPRLVEWVRSVSPLGRSRTQELLEEFRVVARSLIGSNFITGVAQSLVATAGYYIAKAPQPLFFGLLTFLTSFIPSVGTAIVSLPLAGLLFLMGHPWQALFLAAWSLLLVGTVDNFLRPYLLHGDLHVHGALVFFVIIGGIGLFGVAGLVVGPMALMLFVTMMRFYGRDVRRASHDVAD